MAVLVVFSSVALVVGSEAAASGAFEEMHPENRRRTSNAGSNLERPIKNNI